MHLSLIKGIGEVERFLTIHHLLRFQSSRPVVYNNLFYKNTKSGIIDIFSFWTSDTLNPSSTNNAADTQFLAFPNITYSLAGKYYKDLFLDSTNWVGNDNIWRTSDDGLVIACSSTGIIGLGDANYSPTTDITGMTRSLPPSIGAYEPTGNCNQTLYVNKNATGSNNGLTWSDAFVDLQTALDSAIYGDSIKIAEGIYYPTKSINTSSSDPRDKSFHFYSKNLIKKIKITLGKFYKKIIN